MGDKQDDGHSIFKVSQIVVVAIMLWLLLLRACVYIDSITPAMQPTNDSPNSNYHH